MNYNGLEEDWDNLLRIRTSGRDDSIANQTNYPYEPTPYSVLDRLANEGLIRKGDCLLDYGCGKGRVSFYLSYQTRCRSIGLDYDERMIADCKENQKTGAAAGRTEFVCGNATEFDVPETVNRCYFFNPFSETVLQGAAAKLRESLAQNPREILLFFYYPSDAYLGWLSDQADLTYDQEISTRDLFEGDDAREKIVVYRM